MSATIDLIALSLLPFSRWRYVSERLGAGVSSTEILLSQCADGAARPGPRPAWADASRLRERAGRALERGAAAGVRPLVRVDDEYPPALRHVPDPPPVLWVAGQVASLSIPAVAIVGSRAGTPYALSVAEQLGADLAARGLAVVSGLARGVDSAAHEGALSAAGVTIAVAGNGVDVVYPAEHARLAARIRESGAVVGELVPGTLPRPEFFPRRNRIISGLVRAVVVIEAGEKSGSLITARCALEQGRDVLAVPGNILSGRNRGGHALLRDGARLVESVEDIVEELGPDVLTGVVERAAAGGGGAGPVSDPVLQAMTGEPSDLGELAARCGLVPVALLPRLLELELRGVVRRLPGGRFIRVGQTC
jgi:DNA processing protein